ncbi:SAM-dependent DNA methyltransferase [Polyangium fumosum]|uniref:site-specific DNA-methyltransferase (adenine-specific) n=2 Tax=Polyangium fumosum TaxID=889272 RepID=A0A4U1JF43_9BACT|nr:SAM-dependent DNA methyltransferase [Polyangium fumosum]
MGQRYVGVLTDGAEWRLYHLKGSALHLVSSFTVDPSKPDVEGLSVWLEGVLATSAKIAPTPQEITRRLGADSPGHKLDFAELYTLFAQHRDEPTVKLKRELWARLLTTAFGTGFIDRDELFVEHTLLVAIAEVIAHAVSGLDPTAQDVSAASLVTGELFTEAQIRGVVDADFFDWIVEVPEGDRFIKVLARRLARFTWRDVEHDVLKVLYESVIDTAQRKQLGEYYTPDWLADRIVDAAVTDPLNQRVLDPSCGSGTFLFHAIRRYLDAADEAKLDNATALSGLTGHVFGMDIHPVAVTFARVTYLLAIGPARLQAEDRPSISIPVYLGDSIQWGQERTLFTSNALVIPTLAGHLWSTELRFPARTLADVGQFDRLVAELSDLASIRRARGAPVPGLSAVFRRYAMHSDDQQVITETFKTLCRLHDDGHNHIWGYYVRNLARPVWLTRSENRVDVLIGNPPWLSYRFMTAAMQTEFRKLSEERGLWAGAAVATNQDLSTLFVLRSIERYLRPGGRFGFVLPWSVLRGRQHAGYRKGRYALFQSKDLTVSFDDAWDLHAVKPAFFPVPSCVILGQNANEPRALPSSVERWSGRLPQTNLRWEAAKKHITRAGASVQEAKDATPGKGSAYEERFAQGATVVPRFLLVVEQRAAGPLGSGAGRVPVRSRRSPNEKAPWKSLASLEGSVDRQFVRSMHLGETVLPYRTLPPLKAIIPWDGKRLLHGRDERLGLYPGLDDWWRHAESLWEAHRSSERLSLIERVDYHRGLSNQFPIPPQRVVYSKSGMYLCAAILRDNAVIDHKLYWGTASSLEEARYLEAILNSHVVTERLRPLQARGEHNPRDYDKYVWHLPIPYYDPDDERHARLAKLAEEAERIAASVALPTGKRFETMRGLIRKAIAATDTGRQIEEEVAALLG